MIYNLVIYIYLFGVKVAGLFSAKPANMVKGRREVFHKWRNNIDENARYIWFHAASLGEFEQGRPLICLLYTSILETCMWFPAGCMGWSCCWGLRLTFWMVKETSIWTRTI